MKTNIVKSIALASVLAVATISSAQAKTYAAGSKHETCYYHNGHYQCTTHYSANPYTYNGNKKQYCGYHGGGSYTCYQPSGIHHNPNNCAPGMLCK
jgi:TRAP-type mannitol/chloroaromatic compound transport system substrate-binding protein